jgi:pimeloyl-ACP methyl ester carboxylesterase
MTPHRSPRQADLIGHDFGAAAEYAAASLDARRVRKLVTMAGRHGRQLLTALVTDHRVILKP